MGGLGSRFAKEGYEMPKPLVNIMGRSMISWLIGNLHFISGDILYIAIQREIEKEYSLCDVIRREFPNIDIRFTLLDGLTRGAAETLYKVTQNFPPEQLNRPTISLDCDTLYFSDVLASFRSLEPGQGCCCYFIDHGSAPIFSYIDFERDSNRIVGIAEKVAISRNANTGAYGFPNTHVLNKYVIELLKNPVPSVGEFYTSALIETMIKQGTDFRGIHIQDFECVGTPKQLVGFFSRALDRRPIVSAAVVLLDLETVPALKGSEQVSDEDIKNTIDEKVVRIMGEALAYDVKVVFSLESGFQPSSEEMSEYTFATKELRKDAKLRHGLLPVNDGVEKAVGWYLL